VIATGRATYPEVSVACEPIGGDPADPTGATITNPKLIVEVVSPTTEHDDHGSSWRHYQQIASLEEYVLVQETDPRVERYCRMPNGVWDHTHHTSGVVVLSSGAEIDLERLYDGLPG